MSFFSHNQCRQNKKNVALDRATFCRVLANFIADLMVSTRANFLFKLAANNNTFFTDFHQLFFATLPLFEDYLPNTKINSEQMWKLII